MLPNLLANKTKHINKANLVSKISEIFIANYWFSLRIHFGKFQQHHIVHYETFWLDQHRQLIWFQLFYSVL